MQGCKVMTPEVKKNFNQTDFRDNMKASMYPAGIEEERVVFLINDN